MKLVFLILAHRNPEQAAMLIDVLAAESGSQVLVHVDKKSEAMFRALSTRYAASNAVKLISERHKVYWGSYGQIKATLALLREAAAIPGSFYCMLMSGQDFPVRPLSELRSFLEANDGRQFVVNFRLPDVQWSDGGLNRVRHYHFDLFGSGIAARLFNKAIRLFQNVFRVRRKIYFPLFGGSNWFTLHSDAARYVVSFVDEHRDFDRQFRHTRCADEIWLQTILMNSKFASSVTGEDLRLVDWSSGPEFPRTWRMEDLDRLLGERKAFFARKFDLNVDARIVEALKHHIEK